MYTPASTIAAVGDTVTFIYHPMAHSVTQSSFANPCSPLFNATTKATGFDSGFVPSARMFISAHLRREDPRADRNSWPDSRSVVLA